MKIPLLPLLLAILAGCQSPNSKSRESSSSARGGFSAALAGEWVSVDGGDEYLLFKPDETEPKYGRFSGLRRYDRYEIRGGLIPGNTSVELSSVSLNETDPPMVVTVNLLEDGRRLKLGVPSGVRGRDATQRVYRKAAF